MEPEITRPDAFRFGDARQEGIHRRLILVGPGPAAFFVDACQLMECGETVASRSHLMGHLLRSLLGECLIQQRRFEEAETILLLAHKKMVPGVGRPEHPYTRHEVASRLIDLYQLWGKTEESETWRTAKNSAEACLESNHGSRHQANGSTHAGPSLDGLFTNLLIG